MTDQLPLVRFSMRDVDRAPESPGLYAWYVTFRAGPQDWKVSPGPNGDQAIEGFLNIIREYAGYYEPLPIELAGRGSYGTKWEGLLEQDFPLREPQDGSDKNRAEASSQLNKLLESLANEERRRVMTTILQRASPIFSSPLYIGVAENLRQRLGQHKNNYMKAYDWLREHPSDIDIVRARGKSFGARAAARGIAMEHLEAWIIDLANEEDNKTTKKHLRSTAEAAEWLLHRLYSPILGRQ